MNRRGFFRKAAGAVAVGAVAGRAEAAAKPKAWHVPVESCAGVDGVDISRYICGIEVKPLQSFDEGLWLDPRFVKQMEPMTVTLEWAPEVEYEMVLQPKTRK